MIERLVVMIERQVFESGTNALSIALKYLILVYKLSRIVPSTILLHTNSSK